MIGPDDLTPAQLRNGRWYKREDLFSLPNGVNGAKLRACFHLVRKAKENGAKVVISASSVLSPQAAMGATVASEMELDSITVVGGTTPEKAVAHQSVRMAEEAGSFVMRGAGVGYNPAIQSAARKVAEANPGGWVLPYGITTPEGSSREEIQAFLEVGARQVDNFPSTVEDLVLPFGSGNTAAGVLYGLARTNKAAGLKRTHLMTIGPDRRKWLEERLGEQDVDINNLGFEIVQHHIHPFFAEYGDKMPETVDDIKMHPTYEGKVVRYLNMLEPDFWMRRNSKTMLWIVGGPLP